MATKRYCYVRNDIYNRLPKLKNSRSLSKAKNLFKFGFWALLLSLVISGIAFLILYFLFPNAFWWLIPVGVIFLITIIYEYFGEKLYNPSERKKEINDRKGALTDYVQCIDSILKENGINTTEQRKKLLSECKEKIELHNSRFKLVNSKISNLMLGAPLGAFVSAIIYNNTKEIGLPIVAVVFVGLSMIGGIYILERISYYANGLFKDEYLLNALKEIEYLLPMQKPR